MIAPDISIRRLQTQRLIGEPFNSAKDAVAWLGALQAQDYSGAKWALGLRVNGATDVEIDRLFDAGTILRTHVLRPTWHFVLPSDIHWLLELTGPRVKAAMAGYDRRLEIDEPLLRRSYDAMVAALTGGAYRTRDQLAMVLGQAGISATGPRLGQIVMHAELDGLIASGPRRGKQHTYALLAERAPNARRLDPEAALAELTRRYFTSHGPAQVQDFAWWAGLTVAEARRGLSLVVSELVRDVVGDKTYWCSPDVAVPSNPPPCLHLLPNYDEFLVAYRDRSASLDPARGFDLAPFPMGSILAHIVVRNGQVWGAWKRRQTSRQVVVELGSLDVLAPSEFAALRREVERFARFLGVPASVEGLSSSHENTPSAESDRPWPELAEQRET